MEPIIWVVAGSIGFCTGMVFGFCSSDGVWQKSAIKNGAAEWQVNPKTGEKSFVWLKRD